MDDLLTLAAHENPLSWSPWRKWPLSIIVIMMSATMGYYSGVHAASIQAVAKYYGTSEFASTSAVSFFLLGFALGPLLFAPLSEMLGRNPIIRVTFGLFVISNIGCALAPNIQTLLFFRFLGGILGAPTGTNCSTALWHLLAKSCSHKHCGLAHRHVGTPSAGSSVSLVHRRKFLGLRYRAHLWRSHHPIRVLAMVMSLPMVRIYR